MQLLDNGGGVTVIDDSYNSNPIGATEALEVLGSFTTGQRILVTPGMIELGPLEANLNEALGAKAAEVCDYVVLVGVERTKPLAAGLKAKNFPPRRFASSVTSRVPPSSCPLSWGWEIPCCSKTIFRTCTPKLL